MKQYPKALLITLLLGAAVLALVGFWDLLHGAPAPTVTWELVTSAAILLIAGITAGIRSGAIQMALAWTLETVVGFFGFRIHSLRKNAGLVGSAASSGIALYCLYLLQTNQATVVHVCVLVLALSIIAIIATIAVLHTRWAKHACVATGILLTAAGVYLATYDSPQVTFYNQALVALDENKPQEAAKLFDQSINAYQQARKRSQLMKLVLPEPRQDLEARAYFHKASCLIRLQKPKEAVEALKKSLRSNPGNAYSGLTLDEAAERYNDALHAQSNLEKLFASGQPGGRQQGMGNGRGQGQPQPGPNRDRGPQPGAGKKSRDSL